MRTIAFAVAATAFALAGVAEARPWTDPSGRLVFDAPNGWTTSVERGPAPDTFTYVITGNANNECHVVSIPNENLASATADAIRRTAADDTRFGQDFWVTTANGMPSLFPQQSAQFVSRSVDTSGFWPIQRAEMRAPERAVHASIQLRPGFNLMALCQTYDGAEPIAVYDAVIRSVGHPNDAAFQADAETQASAREAAAAAPAPAPQENRRRN